MLTTQPVFACSKSTMEASEQCVNCMKVNNKTPEPRHWCPSVDVIDAINVVLLTSLTPLMSFCWHQWCHWCRSVDVSDAIDALLLTSLMPFMSFCWRHWCPSVDVIDVLLLTLLMSLMSFCWRYWCQWCPSVDVIDVIDVLLLMALMPLMSFCCFYRHFEQANTGWVVPHWPI